MRDVSLINNKGIRYLGPLMTLVITDSMSMNDLHPSGVSKAEYVCLKLRNLFEDRAKSVVIDEESYPWISIVRCFGQEYMVDLWPDPNCTIKDVPFLLPPIAPSIAKGLEAASEIKRIYSGSRYSGHGEPYDYPIVLITDGRDADEQKTRRIIDSMSMSSKATLFIYFLPTNGSNSSVKFDYCASLGKTHNWIEGIEDRRNEILVPIHAWDLSVVFLNDFFIGYGL